jgi:AbiV family abortive infection protein
VIGETVSLNSLLLGGLYALEQSGLLLRDAVILYEHKSYATAIGLALLGREELGLHRLLLDLWRKCSVNAAAAMTPEQITAKFEAHVVKQKHGHISTVMHSSWGTQIGDLTEAQIDNPPESEAYREATEKLRRLTKWKRRQQPKDSHERRMEMFYVDIDGPEGWARPSERERELGALECYNEVRGAVNDYRYCEGWPDQWDQSRAVRRCRYFGSGAGSSGTTLAIGRDGQ